MHQDVKGYFIDIQGTLLSDEDKSLIDGACALLESLDKNKTPYVLVTNNTKLSKEQMLKDLKSKGLDLDAQRYIDPMMVLKQSVGEKSVYPFGAEQFCSLVKDMGLNISQKPELILIASYDGFTSKDYAKMIGLVLDGADILALHGTSTYVKKGLHYPGVGAIMAMLTYATSKSGKVLGKPSEIFYKKAFDILQKQSLKSLQKSDVMFISDDAIGDLVGAKEQGFKTALVLSGKIKHQDQITHIKDKIDLIYPSVKQIKEFL